MTYRKTYYNNATVTQIRNQHHVHQPPFYYKNPHELVPNSKGCRSPVYCANCGGVGHIYKNCNHPVTSYGIICFRLKVDQESQCIYPEYLMVQRKDSLCYVEFIRGKYDLQRKNYIMQLFSSMTQSERASILSKSFEDLWKNLWQVDDCNLFEREYQEAKTKFDCLKRGFILETHENENIIFDLDYIITNTKSDLDECEWGFPKGRRNINEPDFTCAVREFLEETSMKAKYLRVLKNQKPFDETFSGSNRVRYKHVYYLGMSVSKNDQGTFHAYGTNAGVREIKDVKWFRYTEAQSRIRDHNVERKELFKRVNQVVLKNLYTPYTKT